MNTYGRDDGDDDGLTEIDNDKIITVVCVAIPLYNYCGFGNFSHIL